MATGKPSRKDAEKKRGSTLRFTCEHALRGIRCCPIGFIDAGSGRIVSVASNEPELA